MPFHDAANKMNQRRLRQQIERAVAKGQKQVHMLLPDTCTIYPDVGDNFVVDINGIESYDAKVARTYKGFEAIPCRADAVQAFRPTKISGQPSQVDEINLHLPVDLVVLETDIVILNGFTYKIRQLINDSFVQITQVAKLMRMGASLD